MSTTFIQLNEGWNAEPNAPDPRVEWLGNDLRLTFLMNALKFPQYDEDDVGEIIFSDCVRYKLGTLNDEGWYRGQGHFRDVQHEWGEFFEVHGDLRLEQVPGGWQVRDAAATETMHFLFYFRDNDFECDARSWSLRIRRTEQAAAPNRSAAPSLKSESSLHGSEG